jgi:diguanylate cyclase (GGDEF)-like protein
MPGKRERYHDMSPWPIRRKELDSEIAIEKRETLDSLCELIIEELKNFSASHQSVSPSRLHEVLSNKAEIQEFIITRDYIKDLKNKYIKILNDLRDFFGKQYIDQLEELISRISNVEKFTDLNLLTGDIIRLARSCGSDFQEKNKTLSRLVFEIGAQLIGVEKTCMGLIESTTATHLANGSFNDMLEVQITELETSAESCANVTEVRKIVSAKLETIKSALETKKAEDKTREQTFESTIDTLKGNIKQMQDRLDRDQRRREHLEQEILIDPLTGISNRRVIERHIKKELNRYRRCREVFSLIFIDIDDFKEVNDTYGHGVGDKCIQSLVKRIKQVMRGNDLIARYGGDEFIILLTGTEAKAAETVANKLSNAISKTCFIYKNSEIQITVSIGVTQVVDTDDSPESILSRADSALYEAKNRGRDRVIVV